MKLSDGFSAVPGSDNMRYVARVRNMLKLSAVRKIQKAVDNYVGDHCMTLVAFTICLRCDAVHKDGTLQTLSSQMFGNSSLVIPGMEHMEVQRVDFTKINLIKYGIRPGTPKLADQLSRSMLIDWAQDTDLIELPW
jgi:hypothetical protein